MAKRRDRYQKLERYMTYALVADGILFVIFLFFAGFGVLWGKVLTALLAIGISGFCLYILYVSRELLRQRSLWMSVSAAAIILCTLFSLILNFPCPK